MKKVNKPKQKLAVEGKMTLLGYYNALPPRTFPKTAFIDEVADRCGVDPVSVRNWIEGRNKPKNEEHLKVLVELTGIPEEELWQE